MPKPESHIPDNHVLPDAQLEKRTRRRFSEDCVDLQKKALSMLDLSNNGNDAS
jgi:hypothetical protein